MTIKTQILRTLNGSSSPMSDVELAKIIGRHKAGVRRTRAEMERDELLQMKSSNPLRFALTAFGRSQAAVS